MSTEEAQFEPQTDSELHEPADKVSILLQVSNEMVQLFKTQFGRGPTKARTHWAGRDILVVLLEDTLVPTERNLIKLGEHQRVREARVFSQYASVTEFCEPVERITGRKVRSFHSSTDTKVDGHSAEIFVLHPEGYTGPSRIDLEEQ
jgi:uncharacterized protein YbcI